MTPSTSPKTVRVVAEPSRVVRTQAPAHRSLAGLVRPSAPDDPPGRPPLTGSAHRPPRGAGKPLEAERLDHGVDLLQRHAVRGFRCGSGCQRSTIPSDLAVRLQIEIWVEQLPIEVVKRQLSLTTRLDDRQARFRLTHLAHLW